MRLGLIGALAAVVAVGLAAYAVGASKSAQDVVFCAAGKSGALSLAGGNGKCGKGEKKLTIAKQGAAGPVGPAGPQGAPGSPGADASGSLEAVHYVTGPANDECNVKTATFCKSTFASGGWENQGGQYGKVGFYKEPNGIVHLEGVAAYNSSGGESGGFTAHGPFYLPPGYRPPETRVFKVAGNPNGPGFAAGVVVEVRPDGTVATTDEFWDRVALDGISFRAA